MGNTRFKGCRRISTLNQKKKDGINIKGEQKNDIKGELKNVNAIEGELKNAVQGEQVFPQEQASPLQDRKKIQYYADPLGNFFVVEEKNFVVEEKVSTQSGGLQGNRNEVEILTSLSKSEKHRTIARLTIKKDSKHGYT